MLTHDVTSESPRKVEFLRKGFTQVLIISFVCFCCPGFFNALNGLGGAGSDNPSVAAAANATLYFFFAVFGFFGGAFFNIFGPRLLMSLGGLTYAIYGVAAYLNGSYASLNWMFILSGALLGIGAAFLWCAQGSLMLAYAPKSRLGFYISTFWTILNIGGFVGGLVQFGLNMNSTQVSAASPASYFTFIGVMVAGSIAAGIFLVNPSTVIKSDGTEVVIEKPQSPSKEFKDVASVITDRNMILLGTIFFGSNFYYTYVFNGINGFIFTLRTRGLNSALYWASQMVGAIGIGKLLDRSTKSARIRANVGLLIIAVFLNAVYALGCYLEYGFLAGHNKEHPFLPTELVDFRDREYWFPAIVYVLYGLGDAMIQAYSYWVMGAIAGDNATLCAKYSGFYKSVQSLGGCISYFIDTEWLGVPYVYQFWCCWGLFLVSIPTTWMAVKNLPDEEFKAPPPSNEGSFSIGTTSSSTATPTQPTPTH
jgi:MFS family permease